MAVLAASPFLSALNAAAAEVPFGKDVPAEFEAVSGWVGFWESSHTRAKVSTNGVAYRDNRFEATSSGTFELERDASDSEAPAGYFVWTGSGQGTDRQNETMSAWSKSGPRMVGEDWTKSDGGPLQLKNVQLTVSYAGRYVTIHPGDRKERAQSIRRSGRRVVSLSTADGQYRYQEEPIEETAASVGFVFYLGDGDAVRKKHWATVQRGPGIVTLDYERTYKDATLGNGLERSRVVLMPVYYDLEVEVKIDQYETWRPLGSIADPKKPGNALAARAVLKSKSGRTKTLPEVDRFRIELLDTSREPGICLNYPLGATDTDFDLKIADLSGGNTADQPKTVRAFMAQWGLNSSGDYDLASMPPGGVPAVSMATVSENGQKAELANPQKNELGQPYADVAIEAYDFGAKSELRVICVLKDGREILGVMKGASGNQDLVRLPKRAGPDWISEAWRKEHDAMALAAAADDERVAGQAANGDGFTLYEEYRGWVVNGKHVEGDPKRKDFFVLNTIGADGRGGIALFQRLSQLRVHSRLRDGKEISQADRLMNGNRREAPQRVKQHGVVLSYEASGLGGYNVGVEGADKSKAGRPKDVKLVYVERRSADGAFGAKSGAEYGLSERDTQLAYDRGVAHELLHAVGVDHHGEKTWRAVRCYFEGPTAPRNPTRRVRYSDKFSVYSFQIQTRADWDEQPGDTITLLWEDTGSEVALDALPAYTAELAARRATAATEDYVKDFTATAARLAGLGISKDASYWSEYTSEKMAAADHIRLLRVGALGGTDCGNEACVMRYYFANAYAMAGKTNAYYLIRPGPGGNRAGREICRSPAGTGTNAATHAPQSRFGDAAPSRGNCFGDICPNDAIPPRSIQL